MSVARDEEMIVPLPNTFARAPVSTHIRSTLLVSSLGAITRHGFRDAYVKLVPPQRLTAIETAIAGMWLPLDIALDHYGACDRLDLPKSLPFELGGEVVRELQKTFLGTLLKLASSEAGVSAWTGLARFGAIYERSFKGGGIRIFQLGPKDVRVEVLGQPLSAIAYFRIAYRGFIKAGCEFFTKSVFVHDVPKHCTATTLAYRISWA